MTQTPRPDLDYNLYIVRRDQWEPFVERRQNPAYEQVDNALDRIGLNGHVDVVAGAFVSDRDKKIYCDEGKFRLLIDGTAKEAKKTRALLRHERSCHVKRCPKGDHPTTLFSSKDPKTGKRQQGGISHAFAVGFDDRAYTGVLRFRPYKDQQRDNDTWIDIQILAFRQGRLPVQPAPADT